MARNTYEIGTGKYVPANPIYVTLRTESPLQYPPYMDMPLFHENEAIIEDDPHVTLRYGIMPEVPYSEIEELVLDLRSPHEPIEIRFGGPRINFEIFDRSDDKFETVVVPVVNNPFLWSLHLELGCFPNVAIFPEFKPHITIGRFKRGTWDSIPHDLLPPLKQYVSTLGFSIGGGNEFK